MFVLVITTEPFLANILPSATALEFMVIEVKAKIFTLNAVLSPIVAELPTCQNTFLASEPPLKITLPQLGLPIVVKPAAI